MSEIEDLFLHSKPAHILVQLSHPERENHTSEIARRTDCTYSHAVRIIEKMEDNELVETHREGRKKPVELTKKGKKIAEPMNELLDIFQAHNEPKK